jgi:hypothetical protein
MTVVDSFVVRMPTWAFRGMLFLVRMEFDGMITLIEMLED